MISKTDFATIDTEIKDAIENTLKSIKISRPGDYILFLADGEYKEEFDTPAFKYNPYVIDSREDKFRDHDRLSFLSQFLNTFYSFKAPQVATDDDHQRIHMELMIYSHTWESQPFLKRLFRLAHISNNEDYQWDVAIPEMGKHDFIRNDIRQTFAGHQNHLSEVIRKGFHTSLRNAFAHSDYFFDNMNNNRRIILTNYKGAAWELDSIGYDEWSRRFVYSALLSYYLLNLTAEHRKGIVATFGTDQLQIKHPTKNGSSKMVWITYRLQHDAFNFN